jgi:hypothetical protein
MWFLLFTIGALLLAFLGLPSLERLRLPVSPPAEAVIAVYFLVVTVVRLLVRDLRLAAWQRAARRRPTRTVRTVAGSSFSPLADIGFGVGRGVVQVVGGDVLGAGMSLATALMRSAASSLQTPTVRPRERRPPVARESARALACIAAIGALCAAMAWAPLVRGAMRAPLVPPVALQSTTPRPPPVPVDQSPAAVAPAETPAMAPPESAPNTQ